MNASEVEFLYLPVFYWGAFVLLLYRHDLSRLFHPFRDRDAPRDWWTVKLGLGLLSLQQAAQKPISRGRALPYAAYLIVAVALSLSWAVPGFPPDWYFLLAAQAASGLALTMATVKHFGRPPRRSYVDVLRYPRLGSRLRHIQDPTPATPAEEPEAKPKARVRFFNVSLRNGTVVSTPSYPEKQAFCASLIRELEAANPDFAWVQFLFVKSVHGPALVGLKNSLRRAKAEIERPSLDLVSGEERAKRELNRDFYSRADSRMKKADDMATKPLVTLAIQGMWVSSKEGSSVDALQFDQCSDEHDSLAVFQYRDPRMLRELVDRRMVTGIGEYLERYTKSRLEPPSFMVTPEGFTSLVHLPAGEAAESLRSVSWGNSARGYDRAKIEEGAKPDAGLREDITSSIVKLAEVPEMEKILEDASIQPLSHLASTTVRTFELVYAAGHTEIVLSAETVDNMRKYAGLLDSVYGDLKLVTAEKIPAFLRQL
jgi:hypothetical protein